MTDQATPPRFTFSEPTETETRAERRARIVHEAIGAASVCWSQPPAGVFDEQGARQIAAALLAELDALNTTTVAERLQARATYARDEQITTTTEHHHPPAQISERAFLLADDLERDPDRARARTNGETIATVRAAALILRARAADLAARHERVRATCDAIDRLSLIN